MGSRDVGVEIRMHGRETRCRCGEPSEEVRLPAAEGVLQTAGGAMDREGDLRIGDANDMADPGQGLVRTSAFLAAGRT